MSKFMFNQEEDGDEVRVFSDFRYETHTENCPWVAARKLLDGDKDARKQANEDN